MKQTITILSIVAFGYLSFMACKKVEPAAPAEDNILDGPVEGLTPAQKAMFLRGDVAFNDDVFTAETGLGPMFVATSCGSCHAGDGKGHPFTTLTRFGQVDSNGNEYMAHGAPQLQNRAIPGYEPEVIPAGASFSRFMPPANTGMGFLEAVTDDDILAMADPDDKDGDGISGVPNWVHMKSYITPMAGAATSNGRYIGRFGKKAGAYDLLQQTAAAYNQDMGITSVYEPHDTYTGLAIDPEISTQKLQDVVFYLQTLKAPIQRHTGDADVIAGKALFIQADCGGCHKPELKTGYSAIDPLSNKTFHPYTDLLMHDMGPGLDDGYTEGTAKTSEWRTPALWGLGLSMNSQGGKYFLLHDGRAHSIEEAILLHGGEATVSRSKYVALPDADKKKVLKFLESL
ncbi:di-heme oxidoredictase family protein [Nemorincola caseinilytica]|uniref:Di-heme oxidoredictase family protein n=1 Tax=Nemorincola caseinilytica TaxID=2054315 RepID=A0ABP8NAQ6_9BACT